MQRSRRTGTADRGGGNNAADSPQKSPTIIGRAMAKSKKTEKDQESTDKLSTDVDAEKSADSKGGTDTLSTPVNNEVKSRIVRLSFNEDAKSLFWIVDNQVTDMIQNEFGDSSTAYNKLKTLKTNIMKSLKGNTGNTFAAAGSSSESVDTSSHPDKEKLKEDVRDDSSSTDITDVSTISSSSFSKSDLIAIVREQLKEERQQSEADAAVRNDHMSNFSDEQLQKELQRRKVDSQSKAVAKKMFEQQSQASSDS